MLNYSSLQLNTNTSMKKISNQSINKLKINQEIYIVYKGFDFFNPKPYKGNAIVLSNEDNSLEIILTDSNKKNDKHSFSYNCDFLKQTKKDTAYIEIYANVKSKYEYINMSR